MRFNRLLRPMLRPTPRRLAGSAAAQTPLSLFGALCVVDCPVGPLYCRKVDDSPCAVGDVVRKQFNRANNTWYSTADGPTLRQHAGGLYYREWSGTNSITLNSTSQSNGVGITFGFTGYQTNVNGCPIGINSTTIGQARILFPRGDFTPAKNYFIGWGADGVGAVTLDTSTPKTITARADGASTVRFSDGTTADVITLGASLTGYASTAIVMGNPGYQFAGSDFGMCVVTKSLTDLEETSLRSVLDSWRP